MQYIIGYAIIMALVWIAGWFWMVRAKFYNKTLSEMDKLDIYFGFGLGGLFWPLTIPVILCTVVLRYFWKLSGALQDKLVAQLKRPKPPPPEPPLPIYGESKGYRQPPKVI